LSREPYAPDLRIGTSGFSYNDWVGPFYPAGLASSRWFEYYAQEFNCVEINASYYAWLADSTIRSLIDRAPANFTFAIKLHQSLTHSSEVPAHAIEATKAQNAAFDDAEMLAAQLAQFPHSFRPTPENLVRVEELAGAVKKVVFEFRNAEWQSEASRKRLSDIGANVCCVDEPNLPGLVRFEPQASHLLYMRFHGRNAKKWNNHQHAFERYDYLYSESELKVLADLSIPHIEKAKSALLFFNNHYGAQAVTNARQMAAILNVPTTPSQGRLF
jgi:uncharacterized protein YecE (DUF72 family)